MFLFELNRTDCRFPAAFGFSPPTSPLLCRFPRFLLLESLIARPWTWLDQIGTEWRGYATVEREAEVWAPWPDIFEQRWELAAH